jgi:hypothetical protein
MNDNDEELTGQFGRRGLKREKQTIIVIKKKKEIKINSWKC